MSSRSLLWLLDRNRVATRCCRNSWLCDGNCLRYYQDLDKRQAIWRGVDSVQIADDRKKFFVDIAHGKSRIHGDSQKSVQIQLANQNFRTTRSAVRAILANTQLCIPNLHCNYSNFIRTSMSNCIHLLPVERGDPSLGSVHCCRLNWPLEAIWHGK